MALAISLVAVSILTWTIFAFGCNTGFDGFGIYVGTHNQLNFKNETFAQSIVDRLYFDLKLRYFRIDYPSNFSPSPGEYTLDCIPPSCQVSFDSTLGILTNSTRYPGTFFFASIWSPPQYMQDSMTKKLIPKFQPDFYYYITNVTSLVNTKFGIEIEKVSPVNEPENIFATWDHCNMSPAQLCHMVQEFNDPLISLCPENSYFWVTELYLSYKTPTLNCLSVCSIVATHAYALNLNFASADFRLAAYDLTPYPNKWGKKPIWMTEVSSTFMFPAETQMEEGFDLAINIINFLGTTCVERYYYWLPFTMSSSGESLIWGNTTAGGELKMVFPKKYYIFRHFSSASHEVGAGSMVVSCDVFDGLVDFPGRCLMFVGQAKNVTVFLNRVAISTHFNSTRMECRNSFCCTTKKFDYKCHWKNRVTLPPGSVCTCK